MWDAAASEGAASHRGMALGSRRPVARLDLPPHGEPGSCGIKSDCGVHDGRERHGAVLDREYFARWLLLYALPAVRADRILGMDSSSKHNLHLGAPFWDWGELHGAVRYVYRLQWTWAVPREDRRVRVLSGIYRRKLQHSGVRRRSCAGERGVRRRQLLGVRWMQWLPSGMRMGLQ